MTQTRGIAVCGGEHVVQFYRHDRELIDAVDHYLRAAYENAEGALVIATESHRRAFEAELHSNGIDHGSWALSGRLRFLDAAATMAAFMPDGRIDRGAFEELIGGTLRAALESAHAVRAYGEMVALLWGEGKVVAAIELERLWNELIRDLPVCLFCPYPASAVHEPEHADALHRVCHLHSTVLEPALGARQRDPARRCKGEMSVSFSAERDSPGHARRIFLAALREHGHQQDLLDDAALVLSELANNAVLHANSPFSIAVSFDDSLFRIAVADERPPGARAELIPRPGHGLGLIEELCTDWGVHSTASGKILWAELACDRRVDTEGELSVPSTTVTP